jgi:hypothetical protein
VETLLASGENLDILVTAQEPLGGTGERVYRLAPLLVPSIDTETAHAALSYSAVQLFVERAAANSYDFEFGDANALDVGAICRRLDGMPLALELAAARVLALGLKGVLAGLDDRFQLLTAGRRTALPRHRTLRPTADWRHSLLDDERRLFREEMALQSALGTALSWAKGPVPRTRTAWTRACELADVLSDEEVQLQVHYGLWLYHLRCGQYLESLTHATHMMNLSRSAGDFEGLAAGQQIGGVSRHFLGEHAEARSLIEASLKWYEAGHPAQAFRFWLDQHVAGLAFLSRIFGSRVTPAMRWKPPPSRSMKPAR